ncbi:unnamed protein product [Arctogadus glacialis]
MKSFLRNPIQDGRERDNHVFNAEGCPGGDSPTALGVTPRKRLHSAEDARCSSRPAPEGAGSVPLSESETGRRGEEKGRNLRCQQCQVKVAELKKQALSWADPCSLKDPGYAAFLLEQIQPPGGHDAGKGCCQVCSTPLHQLKQEALQTIHSPLQLSHSADMPALSTGSFLRQPSRITISSSASEGKPPARAQAQARPALPPGERQRGLPWPQVSSSSSSSVTPLPSGPQTSVQVAVGGGQLPGTVSSVTIQAQQYLEGMWSISHVNHFLPQPGPWVVPGGAWAVNAHLIETQQTVGRLHLALSD